MSDSIDEKILDAAEHYATQRRILDDTVGMEIDAFSAGAMWALSPSAPNALLEYLGAAIEALEHISGNRGRLQECCRDAFQDDQFDNHDAAVAQETLIRLEKVEAGVSETIILSVMMVCGTVCFCVFWIWGNR